MKKLIMVGGGIGICFILAVALYIFLTPSVQSIKRFESIPEKPKDFTAYTREIWSGAYVELCDLPEEYWRQPEFYGNAWETAKNSFYNNPNYGMWGVYGQGNIPAQVSYSFENLKEGDSFKFCTFVHNGFGIWTYQGFKLIGNENEYFELRFSEDEFVVAPTFPVIEKDWTKKIEVELYVKKTPPIGNYQMEMNIVSPSEEFSRKQTANTLSLTINKEAYMQDCIKYLKDSTRCEDLINNREKKYVNGGSYQPSVPPLILGVRIK